MQIEAEEGDASIVTIAPNNEDGEFYTLGIIWDGRYLLLLRKKMLITTGMTSLTMIVLSMPDFYELPDNLLNVKYKKLGIVEDNTDDLACLYDCSTLQEISENTYTESELIFVELYDLVKNFTIPREAYRRLVRLMNTVIRDNKEKLERETNSHIIHGPQVETMMNPQACFEAQHSYNVDNPVKPLVRMKMMSLGDIVLRLMVNPDTRAELRYRHEYDNRENTEANVIADFFDGEEYKAFKNNNNFQSENDAAIDLFNDGFVTTKRGGRLFTMIHVIVVSYDLQKRYKDEYLILLCILPGKRSLRRLHFTCL
ncbi:hypothetical protein [Parasitella parasitica]|uniref:Uncharacterized protein n=1 Tax=Parasitella parasitica TaxID=35722 RepID=A0A0B7N985_9FUNG|nr:hypothetical protein [Parasitella parasitica]